MSFWIKPLAGRRYQASQQRSRARRYPKQRTPRTRASVSGKDVQQHRAACTVPPSTLDAASRYTQ
eukprot:604036-Pyramimonas_sp.AAC.1